jgi:hypothetical protein
LTQEDYNAFIGSISDFFSQVDLSAGVDGCWKWTGGKYGDYGRWLLTIEGKPRSIPAHRAALAIALGRPLCPCKIVCHRCDVCGCVNPAHLYEGTDADNGRDVRERGYMPKRSRKVFERLTLADAQRMRTRHALGYATVEELCQAYQLDTRTVQSILDRKRLAAPIAPGR